MPIDLSPLLRPEHTALVVFECLEGVIGSESALPGLAAAAKQGDIVANIAILAAAAREASVRVFYCTTEKRADGVGSASQLSAGSATTKGGGRCGGRAQRLRSGRSARVRRGAAALLAPQPRVPVHGARDCRPLAGQP